MTHTTNTRTDAQITRAIAERLGWRVEYLGDFAFAFVAPDGLVVDTRRGFWQADSENAWGRLLRSDHIPDWPNDTGAALALCSEIARERDWFVALHEDRRALTENMRYSAAFLDETNTDLDIVGEVVSYMKTRYVENADNPARALALLALAALEAGDA